MGVIHLMVVGIPYHLAWVMTGYGIAWYVILGAVLGASYRK